eukprot:jgi/Mesen1/6752/ME000344S06041
MRLSLSHGQFNPVGSHPASQKAAGPSSPPGGLSSCWQLGGAEAGVGTGGRADSAAHEADWDDDSMVRMLTRPPPPPGASSDHVASQDAASKARLSHVDEEGKASMVDISAKTSTSRVAVASGRVLLGKAAFDLVAAAQIAKGDVLTTAKIAGITGAKYTAHLIPLCHNILISRVDVQLALDGGRHAVEIVATAAAVGATGVEMEALTAVSVAALTVYDMCKAVSKDIHITDVRLESKTGGKSGPWHRSRQ